MTGRAEAELVLALDAGTTLFKAAIYTEDGRCLGTGEARQGVVSPEPGYAEQEPGVWWLGLRRATRAALARAEVDGEQIAAIGISTQGGTIAVFDQEGKPRGPALVWSDARQRSVEPEQRGVGEEHFRLTGLPHGHMSPAAIGWLKAHHPDWFAGPYRIGYVPDYLTFRLTGEWVSDPTSLGISNLCDLASGDIALPVIDRLGVSRDAFAITRQAGTVAGRLVPGSARVLRLRPGIPVATPAHDQYAAALGAGCTRGGELLLSAGTAWVLLVITDRPMLDRHTSFWPGRHLEPGRWGLLGAISSGSSTLDRMLALTRQRRDWEEVNRGAAGIPAGSDGVMVVPHLVGRTLPSWDPRARGAVLGWALGHTREHLWRATMEGLAMETRVACEHLAARGVRVSAVRMVGGAARSALWASIVASVLGTPVSTCAHEDMALRGAACLAARALGRPDLPGAASWLAHPPVPEWRPRYDEVYQVYKEAIARIERVG